MCLVIERRFVFSCPAKFTNSDSVTNVSSDVSTFESQLLGCFLFFSEAVSNNFRNGLLHRSVNRCRSFVFQCISDINFEKSSE